jgi:hypothetical protein
VDGSPVGGAAVDGSGTVSVGEAGAGVGGSGGVVRAQATKNNDKTPIKHASCLCPILPRHPYRQLPRPQLHHG